MNGLLILCTTTEKVTVTVSQYVVGYTGLRPAKCGDVLVRGSYMEQLADDAQ
jgi:hypothetical protein